VIDACEVSDTAPSVSEENIQIVEELYELYAQGDEEALLARVDPNVEVDLTDRLPDEEVLRGREAYRSFLQEGFAIWSDFRLEVEELLDAGDAVVVMVRTVAVGEGSGAQVSERVAHVVWLRDGTAYRMKMFGSREAALEATGLPARPDGAT
jgi:ketosteroid isomerase-like protein